ncbi:sensor histidine kinase/response regulator [Candidatus Magnetoovum chiemensis]|nr:sensor histidine kinase/response regulator [Candidatus Magnetoovum chiemensis]
MPLDKTKFIKIFLDETKEHLNNLTKGILDFEKDQQNKENINELFRLAHSIKGSAKMMKFTAVSSLAHELENLLDGLRNNNIKYTPSIATTMLHTVDALSEMIENIASGSEVNTAPEDILKELSEHSKSTAAADDKTTAKEPIPTHITKTDPSKAPTVLSSSDTVRINIDKLDSLVRVVSEITSYNVKLKQAQTSLKDLLQLSRKNLDTLNPINVKSYKLSLDIHNKLKELYLKVRADNDYHELLNAEFQEISLSLRMEPLTTLFEQFKRTVRDISIGQGKDVQLISEAGETQLDRKIIEKLTAPLIHIIRNCIDHGIEDTKERIDSNKPAKGTIRLRAFAEGGNVTIEVEDDGRGLNIDKIKEKAVKKKIIAQTELDKMTRFEIIDLIFYPGLSTSDIITDISGRGVGMDVVRKNVVNELNGSIKIETTVGKSSKFIISVPMTLVLVNVLIVKSDGSAFALAANSIREIISVKNEDLIDVLDRKAVRLREEMIPVLSLSTILNINKSDKENSRFLIVIIQTGREKLGLIVDALIEENYKVIKPLPDHIKGIKLVSGVTADENKKCICLLSIPQIVETAKEVKLKSLGLAKPVKTQQSKNILLVDDSINTREIEKEILESYGYNVTVAGDGLEALDRANASSYDLIITDIEMPRMNGFTLTQQLKNTNEYKNIPVIIVSSRDSEEDKLKGIQVGAEAYIIKGDFEQSSLMDTIENLIG